MDKMKSRAQSAIELMILVGAVLFFVVGLIAVFQQEVAKKNAQQVNIIMSEFVLSVQNEINIAARSSDGYTRYFEIPEKVAGKNYSIMIYGTSLYFNTSDGKYGISLATQNVTGQLKKGTNLIRKLNTTIFLN